MNNVLALILGGGRGTRLFPLTQSRSKPAVPLGGKYRIIDIPVSNCINSQLRKIYVVTQYNSKSLNHHINRAYRFDIYGNSYIDILAAQLTENSQNWYMGTADAVRRNLHYLEDMDEIDTVLILSGDQLYRMDFRELYRTHCEQKADVTLATLPIGRDRVSSFGVMKTGQKNGLSRVIDFAEKPKDPALVDRFTVSGEENPAMGNHTHLASMGIYMFKKDVLVEALKKNLETDFGHHIIPELIGSREVAPYLFNGYWEDIGTIKSFHQANLDLVGRDPAFRLYDPEAPIYSNSRFLPPAYISGAKVNNCLISEGAEICGGEISNSVVGLRSVIGEGVRMNRVVMLGADYYAGSEDPAPVKLGVGENSVIENAIIDKNARIGQNVRLVNKDQLVDYESSDNNGLFIRDGVIVVAKNAVIPDGTHF